MSKNLVIVESPAKAKTIEKYLGSDFKVLASIGHIRKDTKVDKDTFEVTYEIDPDHQKVIKELKKEAQAADKVWLATDEDREGEAISWHLSEVLHLPKDTARITFHEITKNALTHAIANPRHIDMDMVSSQQARQTLDMLVGFDLSDVVRKKVPGAKSAGRVQSPALRLVVEREKQIEKYAAKSSFKVTGEFEDQSGHDFTAILNENLSEESETKTLLEALSNTKFSVSDAQKSPGERKPSAPFTTASMQIEANSKLGYSARTTMSAAQGLYQAGLITYHRTDSLNLSKEALARIANYIESNYGKSYLKVRNFKTKNSSAQEAHEAIRPTQIDRVEAGKNNYEKRLYQLIRARALASQMAPAKLEKSSIKITANALKALPKQKDLYFEAKGECVTFDGFLKVYGNFSNNILPPLQVGTALEANKIIARQVFSRPPARFTEGSLIKKLEELGIGRPSTYASIMSAIQSRSYVVKGESDGSSRHVIEYTLEDQRLSRRVLNENYNADKGKLLPTPTGELLAGFLVEHFKNIVDYKFTANIEKDLDLIAAAKLERVKMLRDFYTPFRQDVLASEGIERYNNARILGHDPETGQSIYAKIGKNGGFIQLGENEKSSGVKPRFAPLPKHKSVKTVTLELALKQLALPQLPRTLGKHPDGTSIVAASGPFGPYLKAGKYNITLKASDYDPYTISLEEAIPLYEKKRDSYIADWGDIQIINGVYGPYVKGAGRYNNARIPKDVDPRSLTQAEAAALLAQKKQRKTKTKTKSKSKTKSKKAKASKK